MTGYKRQFKDPLTNTWFKLGIIAGIAGLAAIVIFVIYGDSIIAGGPGCMFNRVTGLYCPGCGGTRAFYHAVHLHFFKSVLCHPIVMYSIVVYFIFMINTLLVKLTERLGFAGYPVTVTVYIGVGILLGQWVVRNILVFFFGITFLQ
ncbi:MAG: DUF2752 domain-containing protein [Lachnospiraceae bacterium]|nr:DUF2752 domain-containing protein [Lachnospiraceae bacterium]